MSKKKIQQIILVLLFTIGGLIFTYPFYSNGINYVVDQYRLKEMKQRNEEERSSLEKEMKQKNEAIKVNGLVINHDPFDASKVDNQNLDLKKHLIGTVTIPKINMTIPLYKTLTNQILENGAGVLQGTSLPTGEKGSHSVISAHRGLAERELFRYLDKLEKGDVFLVDSLGKTLAYEVIESRTVKPEETDVIKLDPEEDLVSLLTCTPYMINSHRLIVTGKRTEISDAIKKEAKASQQKQTWKEIGILIAILLGLIGLFLLLMKLIKNYLLLRRRYDFIFFVKDRNNQPLANEDFIIFRKGKKKALNRDGDLFVSTSNDKGKVKINHLPGDVYTLALKKRPTEKLSDFGIKKLKDTQMTWLKVRNDAVTTKQRKKRLTLTIKKQSKREKSR